MMEGQAEVFDLGYQRYAGPREGRSRSVRAVFWNGVRTMLGIGRGGRAKVLPALLFLSAMLPALVFVLMLSVFPAEGFIPGPADYYDIVSFVLLIFAAIMAPELLIPDRRDNVLQLYLVRPLTSVDYLSARFLAFFVIVLALVYSGQIVLQLGLVLTAAEPVDYLRDNWLDIPRFLAAGVIVALFITAIPLAAATFTTRRAYAAVFVIAAFLVTGGAADALTAETSCTIVTTNGRGGDTVIEETGFAVGSTIVPEDEIVSRECERPAGDAAPYFALIDLGDAPLRLNNMIFGIRAENAPAIEAAEELPDIIPIGVYALLTLGPGLILWRRYRRITL